MYLRPLGYHLNRKHIKRMTYQLQYLLDKENINKSLKSCEALLVSTLNVIDVLEDPKLASLKK